MQSGKQRYCCYVCGRIFRIPKRDSQWVSRAYDEYSRKRQTLTDLADRYGCSTKTLQRHFDKHSPEAPFIFVPVTPVALTFDGTFFGRGYGLMVLSAQREKIFDLQEMESETLAVIRKGLQHLIDQGWKFSGITVDGRKGTITLIKQMFPETPIQFCIFHQKAIIRRNLTTKPKTECGKEIRILVSFLAFTHEPLFLDCLADIKERYHDFLEERNEQKKFMHRKLRSSLRSLTVNAPLLFTWQRYHELHIPSTTNSCDGFFALLKKQGQNPQRIEENQTCQNDTKPTRQFLIQQLFCPLCPK